MRRSSAWRNTTACSLRLTELEPAIKPLFTPLSESASPEVTRSQRAICSLTSKLMSRSFARGFYFGRGRASARVRCVPLAVGCE
jgi:hypothetical protein